jgi:hypothetical protein
MSEPNENKKIPWGNREMSKRDFALVFGFVALLLASLGGIIWYAVNNQPADQDVTEATPASEDGTETAVSIPAAPTTARSITGCQLSARQPL